MRRIIVSMFAIGCVVATTVTGASDKEFASKFTVTADEWTNVSESAYFKLSPGYTAVLEGKEDGKVTVLIIKVLDETLLVDGVQTRVVEERQTEDGQLVEVSRNCFSASKKTGDVYYFGENVDIYKAGKLTGHGGSWRAGVNGAKFGLMIANQPHVGDRYYQELAGDVAHDRAEIVSVTETLTTPAGKFTNCVKTEETTPLEKGAKEYKLYAPGPGLVQDSDLLLTRYGQNVK